MPVRPEKQSVSLRRLCTAAVTGRVFVAQTPEQFTYDANGNVSEYVSTDGSIVAHYDYSPFGETLIETGDLAASFTHRFSTKPWCPVTGLYEYQKRKYRPGIGRWLSRDPIGEEGGGIAILVFCLNNSIGSKGTKSFHIEWKRDSDPTSK